MTARSPLFVQSPDARYRGPSHSDDEQTSRTGPHATSEPDGHEPTLEDVRRIIPARCYDRSTARGLLIAGRDGFLYLVCLAALVFVDVRWAVVLLVVLAGLVVSAMFVVAHDAAHGALTASRRLNRWTAMVFMLPSLHVRTAWEYGHNRVHHGFTVRQGADFVWHPLTAGEFAALSRAGRWRHRLEWSLVGSGLYYLREVWWNKMVRFRPPAKQLRPVRRDRAWVIGGALSSSAAAMGLGLWRGDTALDAFLMWGKLVVAPFLVFTHVIGWTVYVHHIAPDVAWHAPQRWTKFRAQMTGTTILRLPAGASVFFHNIFLHVPHHVDMRIPCYRLPQAARSIVAAFPDVVRARPLRIRDWLATTRACKLYDFEAEQWLTYRGAAQAIIVRTELPEIGLPSTPP